MCLLIFSSAPSPSPLQFALTGVLPKPDVKAQDHYLTAAGLAQLSTAPGTFGGLPGPVVDPKLLPIPRSPTRGAWQQVGWDEGSKSLFQRLHLSFCI